MPIRSLQNEHQLQPNSARETIQGAKLVTSQFTRKRPSSSDECCKRLDRKVRLQGHDCSQNTSNETTTNGEGKEEEMGWPINKSTLPLHSIKEENQELLSMGPSVYELGIGTSDSSRQANIHPHITAHKSSTQLPFDKTSPLWSQIEALEDKYNMIRQKPHFLPLQQEDPLERERLALIMMLRFAYIVEKIEKSSLEDDLTSFEGMKRTLMDLKANGFFVRPWQRYLDKLIAVKSKGTEDLKENSMVHTMKPIKIDSLSRQASLLSENEKGIVELEQKLGQLRPERELIQKNKELDAANISRRNVED